MRIAIIAAVAKNGAIGHGGGLPWRLPDDLAHFKRRTAGRPVIMGRKTWETLRRPLAGRLNLVVTRREGYAAEGAEVVRSLEDALARAEEAGAEEACVIGGAEIYALALARADELVITHVDAEPEGDTFFPDVDYSAWRAVNERAHDADERHAHAFRVVAYERVR